MIGTVLAERYEVTARLASGGMADVYAAKDRRLERTVAVKVLRGEQGDPGAFLDELQAQGQLNHHAVVRLFDAGSHDERTYLVMEYVAGQSLKEAIRADDLSPARIAEIGACVAEALAAAHAAEVIHRDVKPANVLLGRDGQVRLADFGIASLADPATSLHTGVTYGTAAYLAPEHVRGEEVGPPADIYALGLVLLECFTGEREFSGPPLEAAVARLSRDPRIGEGLPPGWAQLLMAMTARDPEDRPSAAASAHALRELRESQDVLRAQTTAVSHRRYAVVAVVSALLIAAGFVTVANQAGAEPVEPTPETAVEAPEDPGPEPAEETRG